MTTTILIADDDPLMHRLYGRHLERAGYRLLSATNGKEAVEMASRELPQLILMDVMMPEMDGLTAVLELQKAPATRAIPVVVITANPQYYLQQRELADSSATSFLTKPFGPSQLLQTIRRLIPSTDSVKG
jgi:CheY-like chemotaxis protein